jgi:streptogramin lyase
MFVRFREQSASRLNVSIIESRRVAGKLVHEQSSRIFKAFVVAVATLLLSSQLALAQTIIEYPLPTAGSGPAVITAGPDGALWFAEMLGNKIGRITTNGVMSEFPTPTVSSQPAGITTGPDGALWFTENNACKIGRITTAGVITEFPTPTAGSGPAGITTGPDGALWFTELVGKIGRITITGVITEFPIATAGSAPLYITTGPDGALWFTENNGAGKIGRITTNGMITEFTSPETGHTFVRWTESGRVVSTSEVTHSRSMATSLWSLIFDEARVGEGMPMRKTENHGYHSRT